jgi:hypothetical protein
MYTSESTKPFAIVAAMKFGSMTADPRGSSYFDDLPNRRLRPDVMTKAQAADGPMRSRELSATRLTDRNIPSSLANLQARA